jgi:outer membrane protein TolC
VATAILSIALTGSSSLFAQSPAQAPAPAGPVLQLSMQQAVDMALETNLGLKAQRLSPEIAAQSLAGARAVFNPTLSSSLSRSTSASVPSSFTQGTGSVISSSSNAAGGGLSQQVPWYGGNYSFNWSGRRSDTTGFSSFNPSLSATVSAVYNQPLWRGFLVDSNRQAIKEAVSSLEIADVNLRAQALSTEHSVRSAYLQLISAIKSRVVAQQVLQISETSLSNTRKQVAAGTSAPNEIYQFEATAASNEENALAADASIASAEDTLRVLVVDPKRADFWSVTIEPTDTAELRPEQIDVDAAIRNALANRTDLITARKQIEIAGLNVALQRDLTRVSVNLQVQYSAQGVGGTQLTYGGDSINPVVVSTANRSFGAAVQDSFTDTNPSWAYGVSVAYPLGRSSQLASLAQAQLSKQQQETLIKAQEQQVVIAVRNAARNVETLFKQVQASQKSREAYEQRLDAEQKKYAVGLSTAFLLSSAQSDLANAQFAELRAIISYNQALIDFESIQHVPF